MQADFALNIGFYAPNVPFTGDTPKVKDLGGAEYCVVAMAENLALLGHKVCVFTQHSQEAYGDRLEIICNKVHYLAYPHLWRDVNHGTQWDVFVISRDFTLMSSALINTKLLVLWNHDILSDPDKFREHIYRADKIFCLSNFHKRQFIEKLTDSYTEQSSLKEEHIFVTRNGVDVALVKKVLEKYKIINSGKKPKIPTFIHSSRPERGLFYLLRDIWPEIKKELPDAVLKLAWYNTETEKLPEIIANIHKKCLQMIRNDKSVRFLGSLKREVLFMEMASSHFMLYPSVFPEISCLSVLESQALGTPAITSSYGALSESNKIPEYILFNREDIENGQGGVLAPSIKKLYDDYENIYHAEKRLNAQNEVLIHNDWCGIAKEWENEFYAHFYYRSKEKNLKIVENLIYHSDLLAAKWALNNITSDMPAKKELENKVNNLLQFHHAEPEKYASYLEDDVDTDLKICPERMKIALELIEKRFGHEEPFTLLDVGCGDGRFLYHVLRNFSNVQVLGIDFSEKLCETARENLKALLPNLTTDGSFILNLDVENFDINELGIQKPDIVFAGEWLEHQIDLQKALENIHKSCKLGGMVIYTVPFGPWEAMSYGSVYTQEGKEIRSHVSHFECNDLLEMFWHVDFSLEALYMGNSTIDGSTLGQYVLSYTKIYEDTHLKLPNYYRKFLTTRPYIRVGCSMIMKNEEENVIRALKPMQKIFDKILVYDTGSTDMSVELCKKYTSTIINGEWHNDFAAARNTARAILDILDIYDVDWHYWQDFDEELINGARLRHYLQGDLGIYESFIITQNQLMLDSPLSADIPTRVYRNKQHIGFFGMIHEEILDLNDQNGNTTLFPRFIIPDIKIAHYGYLTEGDRRIKASRRNYPILLEDRRRYPEREMGKLFMMRDYINNARWFLETHSVLSEEHVEGLTEVVKMFGEFSNAKHRNHLLARVFYQEALMLLAKFNIHIDGHKPFQIALTLAGNRGGLPEKEFTPEFRWMCTTEELKDYVGEQVDSLCQYLDKPFSLFEE